MRVRQILMGRNSFHQSWARKSNASFFPMNNMKILSTTFRFQIFSPIRESEISMNKHWNHQKKLSICLNNWSCLQRFSIEQVQLIMKSLSTTKNSLIILTNMLLNLDRNMWLRKIHAEMKKSYFTRENLILCL